LRIPFGHEHIEGRIYTQGKGQQGKDQPKPAVDCPLPDKTFYFLEFPAVKRRVSKPATSSGYIFQIPHVQIDSASQLRFCSGNFIGELAISLKPDGKAKGSRCKACES
jgi:hypothetical protein